MREDWRLITQASMPMATAPANAASEMDRVETKPPKKSGRVSPMTLKFRFDSMRRPRYEALAARGSTPGS
jgi:hypothetical protein